ncbi:MAG: glucosiduronase [Acidobacteriota bacterium]|nr:glucosiduronase [Acidobacteriota bacterium]
MGFASAICAILLVATPLTAQTAASAWLGYHALKIAPPIPLHVRVLGKDALEQSAQNELNRGLAGLFGSNGRRIAPHGDILLGTVKEIRAAYPHLALPDDIGAEGYAIRDTNQNGKALVLIASESSRGVLYGAFALLRRLAQDESVPQQGITSSPKCVIRWVDEWDNASGTVERGYGGRSIFFEGGAVREDLKPVAEYGRLLASIGINSINLNNVNNAAVFLEPDMLKGVARIADALRPWGVRVALSADIASPESIGGLKTFDPLDPAVKQWWFDKTAEIYKLIPDFAGFTVKADSEGQPGPASYGRTPADAANTLAAALAPHGGIVLYRAFVYNHHLDWRDPKADRARAAYDIFHPLDGKFANNVVIQIKYGPIDFQVREPVSPLFAGLEHTSQAMELQITQEYMGQQHHMVYLAPLWKKVLDFNLHAKATPTPVKDILEGKTFYRPLGGMVGVSDVGRDGWLGSPMSMANLYAFGRLAWNPDLSAKEVVEEWTRLTINNNPQVVATVAKMQMQSWPAYEDYTGPLGLQTLTDITGSHYGPNVEASERNGWGQWHRDDHEGVGMDRSVATGTGYAGQYPPFLAKEYEKAATTPDNLLLFFHHVPYTYKLHDGKTVIQYLYDSHYRGAAIAASFVRDWQSLQGKVDSALYSDVLARLEYQAGHAIVWRDAVTQYFLKMSGIPDKRGRVGFYPGRYEAENAQLKGYTVIDVKPWEDASRGKAVTCDQTTCSAAWRYTGAAGHFNIAAQYFDLHGGVAQFVLLINRKAVGAWKADDTLPSKIPNGDNSTRYIVRDVELRPGDTIRIEAAPQGDDHAALDYIQIYSMK